MDKFIQLGDEAYAINDDTRIIMVAPKRITNDWWQDYTTVESANLLPSTIRSKIFNEPNTDNPY